MKTILRLITLFIFYSLIIPVNTFGQNVAITPDGSLPNQHAMLDVKSTNKGILIPRIDYNNRPMINVPSGMLIYVITNGPLGDNAYYYYNGTDWLREKNSDDVQSLLLTMDTLWITESNYVIVGNILNLIGYYKCNTTYTQVANDNNNCGSCGNVCSFSNASSVCVNGSCSLSCNTGYANCDNILSNGCEINITNDVNNCGSCGTVCTNGANSSSAACISGVCVLNCNSGYGNCDNQAANGCEVNLNADVNNCGACGVSCPSGPNSSSSCISGICVMVCNTGFADCDNDASNGCEVNLSSNVNNCGNCGTACPSGPNSSAVCIAGACGIVCNPGYADCDNNAGNGCEADLSSDVNNCGGCGVLCPSAPNSSASCISGTCTMVCNPGYGDCDNNFSNGCEINLNSVNNCGSCGTICPAGPNSSASCISGTCGIVCNPGYGNCDNQLANGCEVNLNSDVNNCGACGVVCPPGMSCIAGVCF